VAESYYKGALLS